MGRERRNPRRSPAGAPARASGPPPRWHLRCVVAPGLEALLQRELAWIQATTTPLGAGLEAPLTTERGAVSYLADADAVVAVVRRSRLVESVRLRVAVGPCDGRRPLAKLLDAIAWPAWVDLRRPLRIDASAHKSRLYHSGLLTEAVAASLRACAPAVTLQNDIDADPARLWLHLDHDEGALWVEAGAARMHRRGWRQHIAQAPLRETLAAAVLRASILPWGGAIPAVIADPCCGSGTLLCEAADIARGGDPPRVGALGWSAVAGLRQAITPQPSTDAPQPPAPPLPRLIGGDRDPAALAAARANAAAAGVDITWYPHDVGATVGALPVGAALVTNLPYGARTAADAPRTVRALAAALRLRPQGGPAYVLDGGAAAQAGVRAPTILSFDNQGLSVRLLALRRSGSAPR